MADNPTWLDTKFPPMHPGEVFDEIVRPSLEQSNAVTALGLKLKIEEFHAFCRGERHVDDNLAAALSLMAGGYEGNLWVKMQEIYDTWHDHHRPTLSEGPNSRGG